jgi:hypothetical protein
MKTKSILFMALTMLLAIALSSPVYAGCTSTSCIDYQGMLTDSTGNPVTGDKTMTFLIYGQESEGTALWQETQTVSLDNNGLFNTLLGEATTGGLPDSIFDGGDIWLEVEVSGENMGPRKQIVSVGYALRAEKATNAENVPDHIHTLTNDYFPDFLNLGPKRILIQNDDGFTPLACTQTGSGGEAFSAGHIGAFTGSADAAMFSGNVGMIRCMLSVDANDNGDLQYAAYFTNNHSGYETLYARNDAGGRAAHFSGDVYIHGDFDVNGSKNAVVEMPNGEKRRLSAIESPGVWFEDFGTGELKEGEATIKIEDLFCQTVNAEKDYHVFLTPRGDCNGLYVVNQSPSSFEVRELKGGTSNIRFDYRIIAKRKGYEDVWMAKAKDETHSLDKVVSRSESEKGSLAKVVKIEGAE